MEAILKMLGDAFLQHGPIGLLALVGWTAAGWFLFRDFKKKDKRDSVIKAKEEELSKVQERLDKEKDDHRESIEDLSEKRLADVKETIDDYNELAVNTTNTIDKLAMALEIKNVR